MSWSVWYWDVINRFCGSGVGSLWKGIVYHRCHQVSSDYRFEKLINRFLVSPLSTPYTDLLRGTADLLQLLWGKDVTLLRVYLVCKDSLATAKCQNRINVTEGIPSRKMHFNKMSAVGVMLDRYCS